MLISAFTDSLFASLLISAIFSAAIAITSLRRIHDAALSKKWLLAPCLSFALVALIITFTQHHNSYYLLFISALCSAVLLTYPSKTPETAQPYTMGYIGPVDMSEYQETTHQGKSAKFRIEPSLEGESIVQFEPQIAQVGAVHQRGTARSNGNTDFGELLRLKLLSNKKAQVILTAIIAVTLLSVLIPLLLPLFNNDEQTYIEQPDTEKVIFAPSLQVREFALEMPDNFTLYLSEHQGIIINWQADLADSAQLWSQTSAKGDESCQQISFNKGKAIRTLDVVVENNSNAQDNSNYFASFSPLDSQVLIQALAFRGSFSLCGYDFSLKGSQSVLGKNKHYAHWIEY